MGFRVALLLLVGVFIAGCSSGPQATGGAATPIGSGGSAASPTPTPIAAPPSTPSAAPSASEFRHGPDGLVADLSDAGADAEVTGSFDGEPLASSQIVVCVNGEQVRVFPFSSEQERMAVSAQMDPTDPSNIGTAMVSWDGWPQFWQRDRIIVLYLGRDEETIELLTGLLGDPFAQGQPRPQMLPADC